MFKQKLYQLFYSPFINLIVRSILKPFSNILPDSLKIPVSGIIEIKCGSKKIKFKTNETSPMTKILFWEDKGCTFEFSEVFKALIKKTNTFFDIGANIGYYSLLGKTLNPQLTIFSFEPSIGPKYFLKQNIKLNNFNDIHIVEKALGDRVGNIQFYEEKNPKYAYQKHHASGIGNTENTWGINNFLKYDVSVTTIDQVVNEFNVNSLDLIKIDTEGTENFVFKGGIKSLLKFQPIIICEVLKNKIEDEIQKIVLEDLNYKIFQFQSKTNKLKEINSIKGNNDNGETNYFFVPKSKLEMIEQFI